MVEVGETMADPVVVAMLPIPWLMEAKLAFVRLQERVLETPDWMERADAVKAVTPGARLLGVTLPDAEEDAEVPAAFTAVTTKV